MEKDSIDKIDEQINNILNEEKEIHKKEEIVKEEEVVPSDDDTKKIDKIEDLSKEETVEEVKEEPVEEVKEEVIEEKVEETPVVEEKHEEKKEEPIKKNDTNFYLYLILGVVTVFVLFILLFFILSRPKAENKEKDHTLTDKEQKEIIEDYGSAIHQLVIIYLQQKQKLLSFDEAEELVGYEYDIVCNIHEIYEDGDVYLNDCSIDQVKTKYSYGKEKQEEEEEPIILDDKALHVYISKKDKKARLTKPSKLKEYDIYEFTIDEPHSTLRILGDIDPTYVYYATEENRSVAIYNFKKKEKLFGNKYCSVYPIKYGKEFDTEYVVVSPTCDMFTIGVMNIKTGNFTIQPIYALTYGKGRTTMEYTVLDKGSIVATTVNRNSFPYDIKSGIINYRTGEEIVPVTYSDYTIFNKYVMFRGDGNYKNLFDFSGKELLASYKVFDVKDDYVLVEQNGEIKLVTIEGKEIHNFGKFDYGNYRYCYALNGELIFKFQSPTNNEQCLEFRYNKEESIGSTSNTNCSAF